MSPCTRRSASHPPPWSSPRLDPHTPAPVCASILSPPPLRPRRVPSRGGGSGTPAALPEPGQRSNCPSGIPVPLHSESLKVGPGVPATDASPGPSAPCAQEDLGRSSRPPCWSSAHPLVLDLPWTRPLLGPGLPAAAALTPTTGPPPGGHQRAPVSTSSAHSPPGLPLPWGRSPSPPHRP